MRLLGSYDIHLLLVVSCVLLFVALYSPCVSLIVLETSTPRFLLWTLDVRLMTPALTHVPVTYTVTKW